jgi:hypothetical protein
MEATERLGAKELKADGSDPATAYREAINANAEILETLGPSLWGEATGAGPGVTSFAHWRHEGFNYRLRGAVSFESAIKPAEQRTLFAGLPHPAFAAFFLVWTSSPTGGQGPAASLEISSSGGGILTCRAIEIPAKSSLLLDGFTWV